MRYGYLWPFGGSRPFTRISKRLEYSNEIPDCRIDPATLLARWPVGMDGGWSLFSSGGSSRNNGGMKMNHLLWFLLGFVSGVLAWISTYYARQPWPKPLNPRPPAGLLAAPCKSTDRDPYSNQFAYIARLNRAGGWTAVSNVRKRSARILPSRIDRRSDIRVIGQIN